ncbi:Phage tail tube protein FII [compost metagenome]
MAEKIKINRVTNANIYVDGISLLGRAEEVSLPTIKNKNAEHKALGMVGIVEYFAGIDKLEMKIKWNSFYTEVMKKAANPFEAVKLQIRSSIEGYQGGSRVSQTPVIIYVTAQYKDFPLGNFKQHDNVELESNLSVTYCKMEIDGEEVMEIDVESNIYKVNGEDLLAQYRENLGI